MGTALSPRDEARGFGCSELARSCRDGFVERAGGVWTDEQRRERGTSERAAQEGRHRAEARSRERSEPMNTGLRVLAVDDVPPALNELCTLLREAPEVAEVVGAGDPLT